MKCLKCDAYVYNSDKFCRNCGIALTDDNCKYGDNIENSEYDASSCHTKQYNYSYNYSHQNKDSKNYTNNHQFDDRFTINYENLNDSGNEDKYVKAYVGPNYEHIKRDTISIPTIIFGPLYFLYRKLYKQGIIFLILTIIPDLFLKSNLATIVSLGIRIFYTLKFKDMYFKHAEEKVEKIKQENLDKTTNELFDICNKTGGTSLNFIKIIIAIAIVIIITFVILGIVTNNTYQKNTEQYITHENSNIKYKIPLDFERTFDGNNYKTYQYSNNDVICNVTVLNLTTTYSTAEEYINKTHTLHYRDQQETPVQEIVFNNNIWKYKKITSPTRTDTFYAKKDTSNDIYIVKTYDYHYNSQSNPECNIKYNEFLNTIEFEDSD